MLESDFLAFVQNKGRTAQEIALDAEAPRQIRSDGVDVPHYAAKGEPPNHDTRLIKEGPGGGAHSLPSPHETARPLASTIDRHFVAPKRISRATACGGHAMSSFRHVDDARLGELLEPLQAQPDTETGLLCA